MKQELHNTGTVLELCSLWSGSLCHAENFYPAYKIRFQNGFEVGFIFNIGFKGGVRTLGLTIRVND